MGDRGSRGKTILRADLRIAGYSVDPNTSDDLLDGDPIESIVLAGRGIVMKVDRRAFVRCRVPRGSVLRVTVEVPGEAVRLG